MVGTAATTEPHQHGIWRFTLDLTRASARSLTVLAAMILASCLASAQDVSPDPLEISGNSIYRWKIGDAEASVLEGDCVVVHDGQRVTGDSVLVVVDGPIGQVRSRVVIAGMKDSGSKQLEPQTFTFVNFSDPRIAAPMLRRVPGKPSPLLNYLPDTTAPESARELILPAQFSEAIITPPQAGPPPITLSDGATTGGFQFFVGGGSRSVEILARGASSPPQIETINRPELGETLIVARGGVTLLIRDVTAQLPSGELLELGTISLSADRVVGWLPLVTNLFNGNAGISQAEGELYLEGDIVFRQGERIIYADQMYYNITQERGMVRDAEAITTVPEYMGIVRLKADVLQQVARGNFIAFDAAVTSSRMGVPRYWLQSQQLTLQDRQRIVTDPATGIPIAHGEPFVNSRNNFVYFSGVPIFYWPKFSTSLERPTSYVSGVRIKNDNIFGTQVFLDFDLFQVFGIANAPRGVEWELSLDYLTDRGPAIGTNLKYDVPGIWGYPGPARGFFDTWIINDDGMDTLGRDRKDLVPEATVRGRSLLRHRHYLGQDYELIGEIGWVSDRSFLEQYLENEWDQAVDHRTGLRLRHYHNSHLFDLSAYGRVNDFYTVTEQLPRLDHYLIGGSLLGDRLTLSGHSKVGYERLRVGNLPTDPAEAALYSPVPGEVNAEGIVASTRQELLLPVQIGPVRLVPSVSGEAAHYGEATNGEPLTRLLGQAGITASLSAWRADPSVQSALLNIRGLAHKVEWTAGYFYADSDTNLDDIPLYDPLDDNAQEQFRYRLITETFGGTLPPQFDPRYFAFRQGFQRWMASPSDVIAADLQQISFGLHQRWQTKRGLPGRERIVDLLQFDIDTFLFPDEDRDNFGEQVGPTTYDLLYHVGDRVTLLSNGYIDFFDNGLRSISAGVRSSRPGVGDIYLGLLSLEGPISSTVLRGSFDYRLNEKWIATAGTTYDFGDTGNVGQTLALTRIGESMLLRLGVNVDEGRDNVGVGFAIEPRFWPRPRLGRIGGQLIPPPGVEGLE